MGNEQSDISDPFATFFEMDFSSDPFDWLSWSSTSTRDIENPDTPGELDNDYNMVAMSSTIEDEAGEHSSFPIFKGPLQNLLALGRPVLHKDLFGKFEALLNMCKSCVTISPQV
jgi:hypothetical protein